MGTTTKKTVDTTVNETVDNVNETELMDKATQPVTTKKAVKNSQPKEDLVTIRLPKERRGEDNYQLVSLNGKTYKIMKGVNVEVPRPVAEIIRNAEKASAVADRYIEGAINVPAK